MSILFFPKNEVIARLDSQGNAESISSGKPIPIPNAMKLKRFKIKSMVGSDLANNVAMNKGLHGITTMPKKNPNKKALIRGFFEEGEWNCGNNDPMSNPNIKRMLIIPNTENAIGDTTPITSVKDVCKILVNNKPTRNMKTITPNATTMP